MFAELQFREYYRHLADDELARIALESELVPAARQALADELQSRGLTDLSEYKTALEQAAVYRSSGYEMQIEQRMEWQMKVAVLVFLVWLFAIALPPIVAKVLETPDAGALAHFAVLGAPIAVSCYFGLRARRQGAQWRYRLLLVLPLILLALSTTVVVFVSMKMDGSTH